jgi:general secretion pathway protein L
METNAETSGILSDKSGRVARYSLERVRSRAADLYRWWWQELLQMVPVRWHHWTAPRLRVEASTSELLVFKPPQQAPIDRIQLCDAPSHMVMQDEPISHCELVLSSDLGLATPITLPDAAEANLRNVVGFSMDRYTPFREAEVHFDVRITRRDRSNSKIDLMLYVVPRATLERLLEHLAAMGLKAARVDIIDEQQQPSGRAGVNLLPPAEGKFPALRARLNGVLAITALLLLITVLVVPLYQRHQTMRGLEHELEALRLPVREAEQLREDVNRRSETLRIIMERRNSAPPALDLIRELTRLTPDEAWAGQLEIKSGRLRITGEATAGSELLQALTTSGYFTDPRFESPLTQNPKSGRERFVISLAIKERENAP